ncbi:CheR family methyltransferase [Methylobacterium brachythecii]|uniref:protein-glutamate O-methyltransferase n=1 Tax=Methylobacterium brachythecii TaxID=1176177 RepID=A0A7W6F6G8_9HYPH|nr:protein-glutamate O-methyltransferase CheR [Methylobacterium brachythecii]MBB3902330.1 chemotaxis protein methyltransferase CheR [Methylobacterium brachythecii]GLS42179.1 protein-glutamate O-methyltransferase [Methylobacterium brachythecii]
MPFDSRRRRGFGFAGDAAFPALKARVIARTGHHYYADKDALLFDRLVKRFRALNLADCSAYLDHLDGAGGREEWTALEAEITIGETFFFRYAEQFVALRERILPALIEARGDGRTLRIWSAGCSTGAEPYSVAILLHELLGADLADWDIAIVGTDISAAALATARAGEFGRWALRTMPAEDRTRWFQPIAAKSGATREGGYRLRAKFREMVRFERGNLMGLIDGSLPATFAGFDLILCRNVLIYFSADHVIGMMRGFADRLRQGGWLLIGHAEPNPTFDAWLTPMALPGTAAYRRKDEPLLGDDPQRRPAWNDAFIFTEVQTVPTLADAETTPPSIAAAAHITIPEITPKPRVSSPVDLLPQIRALADAGETGEAWRLLVEALKADPTVAALRYYEALLARDLGREAEAERAFRGALFLDRDFAMAHLHLGLLLSKQGRRAPAIRALDNALRLAQGLPPDEALPEGDGVTAGELTATVRLAFGKLGRGAP